MVNGPSAQERKAENERKRAEQRRVMKKQIARARQAAQKPREDVQANTTVAEEVRVCQDEDGESQEPHVQAVGAVQEPVILQMLPEASSSSDSLDLSSWANSIEHSLSRSTRKRKGSKGKERAIEDGSESDSGLDIGESLEEAANKSGLYMSDSEEEMAGSGSILIGTSSLNNMLPSTSQPSMYLSPDAPTARAAPRSPIYSSSDEESFDLSLDSASLASSSVLRPSFGTSSSSRLSLSSNVSSLSSALSSWSTAKIPTQSSSVIPAKPKQTPATKDVFMGTPRISGLTRPSSATLSNSTASKVRPSSGLPTPSRTRPPPVRVKHSSKSSTSSTPSVGSPTRMQQRHERSESLTSVASSSGFSTRTEHSTTRSIAKDLGRRQNSTSMSQLGIAKRKIAPSS